MPLSWSDENTKLQCINRINISYIKCIKCIKYIINITDITDIRGIIYGHRFPIRHEVRDVWVVANLNLPCPGGIRAIHTPEAGASPSWTTACGVMAWYHTRKVPSTLAVARAVGVTSTLWMAVLITLDAESGSMLLQWTCKV